MERKHWNRGRNMGNLHCERSDRRAEEQVEEEICTTAWCVLSITPPPEPTR